MTAIAGYWSFDGGPGASQCARMLAAQEGLGPDDRRQLDSPPVSFGRNLFRILPEDSFDAGPVVGAGGRLILVADIRLDDRDGLGSALGIDVVGLSDAAVAMKAFERWGEAAVERLYGDFALALWDGERRRLLLARDITGQRPLHYRSGAGFFAFASMPSGLLALGDLEPRASDRAIADFLALLPETDAQSFFEGVAKVLPGHVMTVTADGVRSAPYWRPSSAPLPLRDPGDAAEALRDALDRAVRARLRGASNGVAAHLSGGLDSGAVTATAARLLSGSDARVVAYTAAPRAGYVAEGFGGSFTDEALHAAATAGLYPNIDHEVVRTGHVSPIARLANDLRLYQRPMLNVANMPWVEAINDDARRRGLSILLTGASGNLTISYDGLHLVSELFARARLLALARTFAALRHNGARWGTLGARTLGPFLPAPLWRSIRRMRGSPGTVAEAVLLHENVVRRFRLQQRATATGLPRRSAFEARLATLNAGDPGNYNAGTLMGWGLDVRDPTADRALIELCLRIPGEAWLHDGRSRGLARLALSDRLAASAVDEQRKGLQAADWHEGFDAALPEFRQEVALLGSCPQVAALLDVDGAQRLIESWPATGRDTRGVYHLYRQTLLRAVAAGSFMRRVGGMGVPPDSKA